MALLQPKLTLKVSQRQVLTPGLMQMVSVLALNKLELKEMIDAEMVENPVLEEIDETVPMSRKRQPHPRTSSTRSTSDRISRTTWTPATGRSPSMKRARSPRLKTFSPSLRLSPITWRGSWEV
jgi:DNA-directed RNA polymerase specialized sigma54-like protein